MAAPTNVKTTSVLDKKKTWIQYFLDCIYPAAFVTPPLDASQITFDYMLWLLVAYQENQKHLLQSESKSIHTVSVERYSLYYSKSHDWGAFRMMTIGLILSSHLGAEGRLYGKTRVVWSVKQQLELRRCWGSGGSIQECRWPQWQHNVLSFIYLGLEHQSPCLFIIIITCQIDAFRNKWKECANQIKMFYDNS